MQFRFQRRGGDDDRRARAMHLRARQNVVIDYFVRAKIRTCIWKGYRWSYIRVYICDLVEHAKSMDLYAMDWVCSDWFLPSCIHK